VPAATAKRRPRLRRSDCSGKGIHRVRRGRGFSYRDSDGSRVSAPDQILRIKQLAIPPAWEEVWICRDPLGHLQATGVDAAGRKQYLYHPRWRELRDREKFEHMLAFAGALPRLRRRVLKQLAGSDELDEQRVLACAVRLLDVGLFRIGSEQYAGEDSGIGLATVERSDVKVDGDEVVFDYPAKGGVRRVQAVPDPASREVVRALRRRRAGPEQLLAYRERGRWHRVSSEQINDYLKEQIGQDYSAKDFRTWNATVLAAVSLAVDGRQASSQRGRKRAIDGAVRGVSEVLGNTPAVARRSYIDPRVFDRYLSGWTIGGALERIGSLDGPDDRQRTRLEKAVIELLRDQRRSPAIEHFSTATEK
jgi:DNA topoisomerase IB